MAKLRHATAKRANEAGVTMEHNDDQNVWTATKGEVALANPNPGQALDATIFQAMLVSEYPALTLAKYNDGWVVGHRDGGELTHLWPTSGAGEDREPADPSATAPKMADLAGILDYADQLGLDPEAGYEEDEDRGPASVVDDSYKRQYAEDGHPNNNGDWLNQVFATLRLVVMNGKKTTTDVQALNSVLAENGIISEDHKFGAIFHGKAPRTNGWEGRFRMSGGNMLRPRISDAGVFIAFGEEIPVPADFAAKWRTKPKKGKKAAPADDSPAA